MKSLFSKQRNIFVSNISNRALQYYNFHYDRKWFIKSITTNAHASSSETSQNQANLIYFDIMYSA